MKILLISTNADEAGAPRHVESIVNGLHTEFQFILICGENGPVTSRLKQQGHLVYVVKEMRTAISPFKDITALLKIIQIVRKHQPDIIHCHSAKAGILGRISAFVAGKKWVYTVHGWGWRGMSQSKRILIIFIERILSKLPLGFYIFVAKDVMNEAISVLGLNCSQGVVIYNGVPNITANMPPSDCGLKILMPARVSSAKDHKSLILAFEKFDCNNSKLTLCGDGTNDPNFMSWARTISPKTYNNIVFMGQRSDISQIYAQSNVVALISNFEALPLSIIEAMSCERAVIATNVGGIPEIITNEIDGILVKPKCIDDIVSAFQKCKSEKFRVEIGQRAKRKYFENFTELSMLKSIKNIYRSI